MSRRILVTYRPPGDAVDRLSDLGELDLWEGDDAMPRDELLARIGSADAIYSMLTDTIDEELLDVAPDLRVVSNMAVGYDNVDVAACTARGIPVGHTPNVLTETVADTAFGLLIAAARRFGEGIDYVRNDQWKRWEPGLLWGSDVHGATLGIVGFGRIGMAVAKRAAGFSMRVIATSRRRSSRAEDLGVTQVDFQELLARSDHIVIAVPLTQETRHMFDENAFSAMKPTATLVNISRGATVDTDALVKALREGKLGAVGLDVTDPEPLPGDHPLVQLPNAFVIPHLGSSTARTRHAMANFAVDNIAAAFAGHALRAAVNPEVAPRPVEA
ncbi:MAG: D-glycerate dehydrogenase [Acidimicrobiia bacterium]|nr:D-glycerate dehydrogenase [Acidimicrobiia bacterium]